MKTVNEILTHQGLTKEKQRRLITMLRKGPVTMAEFGKEFYSDWEANHAMTDLLNTGFLEIDPDAIYFKLRLKKGPLTLNESLSLAGILVQHHRVDGAIRNTFFVNKDKVVVFRGYAADAKAFVKDQFGIDLPDYHNEIPE